MIKGSAFVLAGLTLVSLVVGCGKKLTEKEPESFCAPKTIEKVSGTTGNAYVFELDPIISSGNPNLAPTSSKLDDYRIEITLQHLSGRGVLAGDYVDVRNGLDCKGSAGAYDKTNQFLYQHSDPRFQEAMSYYVGDSFQASLDEAGVSLQKTPYQIIAHCMKKDNAYFSRSVGEGSGAGSAAAGKVCLGDSTATPGAFYSDDGTVVVHELQHGTTGYAYSPYYDLNQFWYDEAGAINEAISDFMALAFFEPVVSTSAALFDPRIFSRWALGVFIPNYVATRGAHRCPTYDSDFPECRNFRSDSSGFSADNNTVSLTYPDGLGWPYAKNFGGPGFVHSAFLHNPGRVNPQEEIHSADLIITGVLWDIYYEFSRRSGLGSIAAFHKTAMLVTEAVSLLPKPTVADGAPVNFRHFASALVDAGQLLKFTSAEQEIIRLALEARGLSGDGAILDSGWAAVGAGAYPTPGLRVIDDPFVLKQWLNMMGADSRVVTQGGGPGMNKMAEPGEVVSVWFDIMNISEKTAGGPKLSVTSLDPSVTFLDGHYNVGYLDSIRAEVIYGKVNGTGIVQALRSSNEAFGVVTGNSYFLTNPFYANHWKTALWVKIDQTVASGTSVFFDVSVSPSNGSVARPSEIIQFKLVVN